MLCNKEVFNLPNLVSLTRLLMAPVLLTLAYYQQSLFFFIVLIFTIFTDVLDGFLARRLQMITALGSRLDSWGDFVIYISLAIAAWWQWPDIILEEKYAVIIIVLSFTLPVLVGLIKFRTLTSYHTWAVKIAVLITIIAYVLVFSGLARWPIYFAALACIYAGLEEILISLLLKRAQTDVRSFFSVLSKSSN